jgi:hypothetical protein
MAIATFGGNMAEAHSFVQVCDQGEIRSAYMTIVILMCLLMAACAYVCKLHSLAKVSIKETPIVQTGNRQVFSGSCKYQHAAPPSNSGKGSGPFLAPAAKRMSVVHSTHLPTWCKDIYLCSKFQLDKCHLFDHRSGGSTVHVKHKYHVSRDCHALRDSQVLQVSLCKLCENKHK